MQTDETIDRYFYITGWICIAVFAALAAVIGVCGTQILTKVPPCPLHAYTGYYCPGCGGTRATFALLHGHLIRSFVLHPFVPYTAVFGGWFMLSADTAADKPRQAAHRNALQAIIYVACTCHYCGKLYSQKYAYIILRYSSAEVAHCSRYRSGSGIPLIYPLCFHIREAWRQTNRYR